MMMSTTPCFLSTRATFVDLHLGVWEFVFLLALHLDTGRMMDDLCDEEVM